MTASLAQILMGINMPLITRSVDYVTVATAEGLRFAVSLSRGQVAAKVAGYDVDTVRAHPSDVSERSPVASCSLNSDPERIARNLTRRVFANPECIAHARAVRALFDKRMAQRETLRQGIATLAHDGWACADLRDGQTVPLYEYTRVTLYKPGYPRIELYGNGAIHFTAEISTDIENLSHVMRMVRSAKGE